MPHSDIIGSRRTSIVGPFSHALCTPLLHQEQMGWVAYQGNTFQTIDSATERPKQLSGEAICASIVSLTAFSA
jgi:hypothetical protein